MNEPECCWRCNVPPPNHPDRRRSHGASRRSAPPGDTPGPRRLSRRFGPSGSRSGPFKMGGTAQGALRRLSESSGGHRRWPRVRQRGGIQSSGGSGRTSRDPAARDARPGPPQPPRSRTALRRLEGPRRRPDDGLRRRPDRAPADPAALLRQLRRPRTRAAVRGAKDAVGRLFALAQALTHDYERFEALVEGGDLAGGGGAVRA